ncbi:MAG: zinc metalloprotease [Verrucomicrobiales bacterium]
MRKKATKKAAKKKAAATQKVPSHRTCGAMQVYQQQLETVVGFRKRQVAMEHAFRNRMRFAQALRTTPYEINVVVHVVYKVADDDISDAQIHSQIDILNKDFRAANPDRNKTPAVWRGLITDAMINFQLAKKDPGGSATTGITRTQTTVASFLADDSMKRASTGGVNAWDTTRYLNMWVVRLRGGLLGYAQFPGGPSSTDGVVILNSAFGSTGIAQPPFNLGRTASHEIGHFLNLRHIWGDTEDCSGGDFVDDTPNAELPNSGKPAFPSISCSNGPHGDMYMNYMDYVDDDSMYMFTRGQVERMHACLDGPRASLVS